MSIPRWVVPASALIYDMGDEPVVVVLERDYQKMLDEHHAQRCCGVCSTHVTPHRGCILR